MEYLIKVSTILILFYTCYKLFLNRETFFESNRSFLLVGLITAFVLPLIVIPKYIEVEPTVMESAMVFGDVTSQRLTVDNSISLTTLLVYTYLAGVLFFFSRFLFQFGSLTILILNSTKQRMASFIYVFTKKALSPFSFFNWIVFNPKQFNKTELEQIIQHEKVHAKQLHSIDILLAEITCIALWLNPLVWLYKKDLRQNLEFIADKNAQATTHCKKSYQHLLLKTSVPNYQMALTNNFYNSLIKKRIVMLHKNRSHNRNKLKFLLILPVLAAFLMSFNTKEIYIEKELTRATSNTILDLNDFETAEAETNVSLANTFPKTEKKIVNKGKIQASNTALKQDIATYFIESTFNEAQLEDIVAKVKVHGITLKIKGVKRNSDNKITAIKIDAESDNSSANFSIANDDAIKTIKISYNAKDNSISIGNTNGLIHDTDYEYTHEDGVVTYKKSGKEGSNNIFVYNKARVVDDENVIKADTIYFNTKSGVIKGKKNIRTDSIRFNDNVRIEDKNVLFVSKGKGKTYKIIQADTLVSEDNIVKFKGNVIIKSSEGTLWSDDKNEKVIIQSTGKTLLHNDSDEKITVQTIGKEKNKLFISGDNDKALYIIDDKEVAKKDLDIDPNNIASVNVLKGEAATKKYGDKGKNGVIEITTKKNKN